MVQTNMGLRPLEEDIIDVVPQTQKVKKKIAIDGVWDHQGNYELNGVGGGDIMFFAFKEEADYVWFTLVWS